MDYLANAASMREQAWDDLIATPAFRAFRACDNMVIEMGGVSIMPKKPDMTADTAKPTGISPKPRRRILSKPKPKSKPTQGDVAELVLKADGPLGINELMEIARKKGATIRGSKPLISFRSMLSKDDRFRSFRQNGGHYWYLVGINLPEEWDEAAGDLLHNAASSLSNQKGGEGHGPATT